MKSDKKVECFSAPLIPQTVRPPQKRQRGSERESFLLALTGTNFTLDSSRLVLVHALGNDPFWKWKVTWAFGVLVSLYKGHIQLKLPHTHYVRLAFHSRTSVHYEVHILQIYLQSISPALLASDSANLAHNLAKCKPLI